MPVDLVAVAIAVLGGAIFAGTVFYFSGRKSERRLAETEGRSAKQQAERQLQELRREAEAIKAQAVLQGREEALQVREEFPTRNPAANIGLNQDDGADDSSIESRVSSNTRCPTDGGRIAPIPMLMGGHRLVTIGSLG